MRLFIRRSPASARGARSLISAGRATRAMLISGAKAMPDTPGPLPKNLNPTAPGHTAVFLAGLFCILWRFVSRNCGQWPAALAVVLFAFCPPILGGGIACHNRYGFDRDVSPGAGLLLEILGRSRSLHPPPWAGAAMGLAILGKLAAVPPVHSCAALSTALARSEAADHILEVHRYRGSGGRSDHVGGLSIFDRPDSPRGTRQSS